MLIEYLNVLYAYKLMESPQFNTFGIPLEGDFFDGLGKKWLAEFLLSESNYDLFVVLALQSTSTSNPVISLCLHDESFRKYSCVKAFGYAVCTSRA